jgi:hypothetical protein
MTTEYQWMRYSEILPYIPEMEAKGVSVKARSRGQFLDQWRKANSNPDKLPVYWRRKRSAFVARFIVQKHTDRVRLALIAWAYLPKWKVEM